jgi:hypothetical protein
MKNAKRRQNRTTGVRAKNWKSSRLLRWLSCSRIHESDIWIWKRVRFRQRLGQRARPRFWERLWQMVLGLSA